MIPDRIIEHYCVEAGHTPGPIQPATLRKAFALMAEDVLAACADVASHYRPSYPLGVDPLTIPAHCSKVAAENCMRAIKARWTE